MPRLGAGKQPAKIFEHLRNLALESGPERANPEPKLDLNEPYGIVMDMSFPNGIATLVSFACQNASLYFSNGGGVLGGIAHESVRNAAKRFVSSAQEHLAAMQVVSDCPLPPAGMGTFYVLAPTGVFAAEENLPSLGSGRSNLSTLFYAGQDVITELRLMSEKPTGQNTKE